jgi:hypothetical protein
MIIDTVVETVVETVVIQEEVNPTTVIITSETPQVIVGVSEPGPQGIQGEKGDQGEAGSSVPLSELPDVDISALENGSVLTYSSASQKWIATRELSNQIIESGQY